MEMSDLQIIGSPTGKLDDCKRCYLPGVTIRQTCPKCQHPVIDDLTSHGLSYPVMNAAFSYNMYCRECDHEWKVVLKLNISLEIVP